MTKQIIAINRKARFNYAIKHSLESGLVLQGWEVKSIRQNNMQIAKSYVIIKNNETWLIGSHINPIDSINSHTATDPTRIRKLLLHRKEINNLIGLTKRKGYSLVPLKLYWKQGQIKLAFALAQGKKIYDKRATKKQQDWERRKAKIMGNKTS